MLMPEMSPPDERGHPRKKFRKIKGFRDIIVGAALESADAVLELMPSSEKESGSRNAAFTQMGQDVEAVAPGEHHVEHDTVIVVAERTVQRFITLYPSSRNALCRKPRRFRSSSTSKIRIMGTYDRCQHAATPATVYERILTLRCSSRAVCLLAYHRASSRAMLMTVVLSFGSHTVYRIY
jgi:hypothetical protein